MRQAARHRLSERELHEYVAEVEGHDSQVTGVVGYFYAMYRAEVLACIAGIPNREILEIGCGEGMMFKGSSPRTSRITPMRIESRTSRKMTANGGPPKKRARMLLSATRPSMAGLSEGGLMGSPYITMHDSPLPGWHARPSRRLVPSLQ